VWFSVPVNDEGARFIPKKKDSGGGPGKSLKELFRFTFHILQIHVKVRQYTTRAHGL
jgi:hypothetical protein